MWRDEVVERKGSWRVVSKYVSKRGGMVWYVLVCDPSYRLNNSLQPKPLRSREPDRNRNYVCT